MPVPDIAILGAEIETLDPDQPSARAVACRDGVILAVGDDASVRSICDGSTELIDGTGMAIVPGLTDSHLHPFWGAEATQGVDLSDVWTIAELNAVLAAEWERTRGEGWITGWGLHFEPFLPTGIRGDTFADAVGSTPVYLGFFDGHTGVANQAALERAGVDGPREFSEAAAIVCDADGRPTGELQESSAMDLVRDAMPEPTDAERYRWYVDAIRELNRSGLTGIHGMDGTPESYDLLRQLEAAGDLTVRMIMPLWQRPETTFDEMRAQLPLRFEAGRRWRGGVAKFFIDGVIESGTAWLVEPDLKGEGRHPFWPDPEKYREAVRLFAGAGFQCSTHAVGDGAVRYALDAYEAAGAADGIRHRIEHIEQLTDVDLPRFAQLGVVASMQPLHMHAFEPDFSDGWQSRFEPERLAKTFRTGDLLRSGATLALGSDWMVAPFDPRLGMAWARLRRRPGHPERPPILPDQRLTALQALQGYTTSAALTVSEEAISGRIAPGLRADLTAFAANPLRVDGDTLAGLPVLMTVVDGEIVYRADD
ncbi:MAG: amidohydrolase [Thermomicrobiales bacterium]|nr:amidohydrolase [Thermomicrobiales bacterium]